MTFKKKGRKNRYVWVSLPGFGRVGPWSCGTPNKAQAEAMEAWLKGAALREPALVRGIVQRDYSLREAWVAHLEGRSQELRERSSDPVLAEVVTRFRPLAKDRRIENGLDMLLERVPKGERLSWLTDHKNISDVCARAVADGRKPNTVRRSLYRAIADLLAYEIGKAERARILADVVKPGEDDARDVTLAPAEVGRLLDACDLEMRPLVELAVLTGIDRGPLLALRVRDFDEKAGRLWVPDKKTRARRRTLELSAAAQAVVRRQAAGRGLHEPMFELTAGAIDHRWGTLRKNAGLPTLRFKDLRHVFATFWTSGGGAIKDLQHALGHQEQHTTLRYTAHQAAEQRKQMDGVADAMGLGRHLRVEDTA